MEKTKIVKLHMKRAMDVSQLQCLRGAVNKLLCEQDGGWEANLLFHNHEASRLRYGYPLVQYRSSNGQTTIVGIGEAAGAVQNLASIGRLQLKLGDRETILDVDRCEETYYTPQIYDEPKLYRLSRYIALTDNNLHEYRELLALTDKIMMLEKILVGNILSFFKGIGHYTDQQLAAVITDMDGQEEIKYKSVRFRTFRLRFVSNVELPDGIGLGKSASVGFGTLQREKLNTKLIKKYANG